MAKQTDLNALLHRMEISVGEVRATVLASRDGLPMAATVEEPERSRTAAVAASVLALSEQLSATTGGETLDEIVVRGDEGLLAVYHAGPSAALAVLTDGTPNVGLLQLEARSTAAQAAELLEARG
jgi:predicted regulator of Ras-like GTPase activity (Roadblock/LC7/MglB family)